MIIVFIDSCVMPPVQLINFLLRLAEAELLRPHWSPQVLTDGLKGTRRARPNLPLEQGAHRHPGSMIEPTRRQALIEQVTATYLEGMTQTHAADKYGLHVQTTRQYLQLANARSGPASSS